MRKHILIIAAAIIIVLALVTVAVAADPFVGTWKLNVAKSKFNPPSSASKSMVVKIEAQDNGLKFTFDSVDAEGKVAHGEYAAKFDGKDYPVKGDPATDAVSLKRIGDSGYEIVNKKGGKETSRVSVVFAKDGKSSTVTAKDAKGQVTSVGIFEKQLASAADPYVGTWKLNVAKSKASDPNALPKSDIVKNEGIENGLNTTYDGVDSQGKAYHMVWSGIYDGKDYPYKGSPIYDTCAERKIDPNTLIIVNKKAGKEVSSSRCVASTDGRRVDCTGKGKDSKGRELSSTAVYEKQ
jgi:hypothetical protein